MKHQTPVTPYQGPGHYRHYKGGMYEVLGLAVLEAAPGAGEQPYVVYRPARGEQSILLPGYAASFWLRPLDNFNEWVPLNIEVPIHPDKTSIGERKPEIVPRFQMQP